MSASERWRIPFATTLEKGERVDGNAYRDGRYAGWS
jgi:hypothetical protein